MVILGIVVLVFLFSFQLFIPFNYELFDSLNLNIIISLKCLIGFYFASIMLFIILVYKLFKVDYFNYDILFLIFVFWLGNLLNYIYFNVFGSIKLSFFCVIICLIDLIFLGFKVKKINKSYINDTSLLFIFYFYLLIILFKFI